MIASYFTSNEKNEVDCRLCPNNCHINEGKTGSCLVRRNIQGELIAENYGKVTAIHFDPVEKKPLYHFHPGSLILSIGTMGCNLHCFFCQNHEISQRGAASFLRISEYTPEMLFKVAIEEPDNIGIAFTYNEPTVWFEFMIETASLFKSRGLKTAMISNGFINPEPLSELIEFIDAFNIDLKAFENDFYQNQVKGSLQPVLDTLITIKKNNKHLEITNLLIPGLNDDKNTFRNMVSWISENLGKETVLHLSRYFPRYKANIPSTEKQSMQELEGIARQFLDNIYLGNV